MVLRDVHNHPIAVTDLDDNIEVLIGFSDESRSIVLTPDQADSLGRALRNLAVDQRMGVTAYCREWTSKGHTRP